MSERKKADLTGVDWKGKTILVAEDVETSNMFFAAALRKTEANVLWAKTGKEAIELAEKHHVDVVLMDIHMPELNGFEATKRIKKIKPGIRVIIQTAYTLSGEKEKGFEAGADDFIAKPITFISLISTINKHLTGR